jgi:CCR4-NOT transcription complex subunit 1
MNFFTFGNFSVPSTCILFHCQFQDFITVWHSQSSQNASATTPATTVPVAPPDSSIASVHGPILAPSASSSFSTLQFAPFTSANQSTELIPDKMDSATTQLSR